MLDKLNAFLKKLVFPINIVNIIVGILLGIAHVYIPFTSLFGLIFGVVTAISGSVMMGVSYYFTAKNTSIPLKKEKPPTKHTFASNLFLLSMLPVILLTAISSFFGMYTYIPLVITAMALTISPPVGIGIAITLGLIFGIGTLINCWLQIHNIWEGLKEPVKQTSPATFHKSTVFLHKNLPPGNELTNELKPTPLSRLRSNSLPSYYPEESSIKPEVAKSMRLK